jgi:hypothetical protein
MSLWPRPDLRTLGGMSSTLTTTIAGVAIPDSSLARDATALIRDIEPDLLYHHSMRVFIFGSLQGRRRGLVYDPELLYIGAMFHDVGLVEGHRSAHDRFEVDGANAARDFMAQRGVPVDDVRVVWDAIALHTTLGIPEHKEAEVALVNAGVALDVVGDGYESLTHAERAEVLAALPRVDFKNRIIEAFGAGIAHKPETAAGTINADVLERTLPGYRRPDFCELILCEAAGVPFRSLAEIERVIRSSWSAETCDPVDLAEWSPQRPARGQCAVTALVVQELFGGELLLAEVRNADGSRQGVHYWNRLAGGMEFDLTREQFTPSELVQAPRVVPRPADLDGGRLTPQYRALARAVRAGLRQAGYGAAAPSSFGA